MTTDDYKTRVQEILDFITEIALGTYTYTLPLRNQKDELEQIVVSLNTMVEEIDTAVHQINHEKSKEVFENIVFNLDRNFHITSYSDNVEEILDYTNSELLNMPVRLLIGNNTELPDDLYQLLKHAIEENLSFKVEFKHRSGYIWRGIGYLHGMIAKGKKSYTLSVFKAAYQNHKLNNTGNSKSRSAKYPSQYRSLLLHDQRELVRKLHQYVMERLDRTLPKISVIGIEVGCSVSKIKTIFKRAYGDTIYAYHRRKRLDKAYTLIKNTSLPFSEISEECGFLSLAHFSRSFKKTYGITPTQTRNS